MRRVSCGEHRGEIEDVEQFSSALVRRDAANHGWLNGQASAFDDALERTEGWIDASMCVRGQRAV